MTRETHTCPVCDRYFFPRRSDAVFCSARCRKRAQRAGANRVKSETQGLYARGMRIIRSLQASGAHNQLRALLIAMIQGMSDEDRVKLYRVIEEDVYRLKRDTTVTDTKGAGSCS